MWLWLAVLSTISSCSADVCYNDVFLHRINALLPSSGPFCLSHFQDSPYEYPALNSDQIAKLSIIPTSKPSNPILLQYNGQAVLPLRLPAALLGDLCSSYQFIEIGRNLSSECRLVVDQNTCTGFSALALFSGMATLNGTIPVEYANGTDLRPSRWINGSCHDLFDEAELRLLLNRSRVSSGLLRLHYSDPITSITSQKLTVTFHRTASQLISPLPDSRVYVVQNGQKRALSLPSLGSCDRASRTQVTFKKALSTGCTLRIASCEDGQRQLQSFLASHLPTHFMANSTAEPEAITRLQGTQPTHSSCVLPISFQLNFYYARKGLTSDYKEEPVALFIGEQLAGIDVAGEMNLPLIFKVRFTDATQEPSSFFSGLPYIDLRLPADAFYPFIRSSSSSLPLYLIIPVVISATSDE